MLPLLCSVRMPCHLSDSPQQPTLDLRLYGKCMSCGELQPPEIYRAIYRATNLRAFSHPCPIFAWYAISTNCFPLSKSQHRRRLSFYLRSESSSATACYMREDGEQGEKADKRIVLTQTQPTRALRQWHWYPQHQPVQLVAKLQYY